LEEKFYYHDPDAPQPNVPLQPGAAAVLFDAQKRILIMKRTRGPYWCLPSGRQDIGESSAACCLRETREETGLETRIVRLIGVYSDPHSICAYPDGNVHQSYYLLYECEITGGELRENEEGSRFHWMSREEMDRIMLRPDDVLSCTDAWAEQERAFIR
jgi:8-oxo-dGTP pyrophosphatase MutT (NUDIX family)